MFLEPWYSKYNSWSFKVGNCKLEFDLLLINNHI